MSERDPCSCKKKKVEEKPECPPEEVPPVTKKKCDKKRDCHGCIQPKKVKEEKEWLMGVRSKCTCDEKDFFLTDSTKVCRKCPDCIPKNEWPKNRNDNAPMKLTIVESHKEVCRTIRVAIEDIMCRMYRTVKSSIDSITSEGSKQLGALTKSDTCSTECKPKPKQVSANSKHKIENFLNDLNSESISDDAEENDHENILVKGEKIAKTIFSKLDSSVNELKLKLNVDKIPTLIDKKFDKSSEYDVPHTLLNISKTEGEEGQETSSKITEYSNRIFSMMKSQIENIISESRFKDILPQESEVSSSKDSNEAKKK